MAPALAIALADSGLPARLRHYVEIRYLPSTASSFDYDRTRATDALAGLVARYDEELHGKKKPAVQQPNQVSRRGADLAGMDELREKGEA